MSGDRLGRYPVSITVPVAWGEMDAFQHVNNVVYARWAESGRIAYFERLGLLDRQRDAGVGPILARLEVTYRRPIEFPDTVVVETTVTRIGNSSFTMANRIRSEVQGIEAASTEEVIVLFDYRAGKPTPIDDDLRAAIATLEGAAGASPGRVS